MKRIQRKGIGTKKRKAEPVTEEEEEVLWEKRVLGDHSFQREHNTFMTGLYYALHSGKEHRDLVLSSFPNLSH